MKKRQALIYLFIAAVLMALIYLQVRTWRRFDWPLFLDETKSVNWGMVGLAVGLIYADYFFRALRWKILLSPVKKVSVASLAPAQFIGFTGLALLGRPGELIRPYLIAKKHELSMPSQMAAWTVERIFDFGSFTVILIAANLAFGQQLRGLPHYKWFHNIGIPVLASIVCFGIAFAFILRRYSRQIASLIERIVGRFAPAFAKALEKRAIAFGEGFNVIRSFADFLKLTAVSLTIWSVIAVCYWLVIHAYPGPELHLSVAHVSLLMGFSVAGGVAQLPFVGGGSQFATISALQKVFGVRPELAVSCGILLWLVTFMSVIPAGLVLARREHVSITKLAEEEEAAVNAD